MFASIPGLVILLFRKEKNFTRTRLGWKTSDCGEILLEKIYSLRMKVKVYKSLYKISYVTVHGSETLCLTENETTILKRAERSMVKSLCGPKFVIKRNTMEMMDLLELKKAVDKLTRVNSVK